MKLFLKFLNSIVVQRKFLIYNYQNKAVDIKLIKILFKAIWFLTAVKVSQVFKSTITSTKFHLTSLIFLLAYSWLTT